MNQSLSKEQAQALFEEHSSYIFKCLFYVKEDSKAIIVYIKIVM
ncbi:hypothetical protein [Paenibacillus kandeliae]